jgi:hypothetical protein
MFYILEIPCSIRRLTTLITFLVFLSPPGEYGPRQFTHPLVTLVRINSPSKALQKMRLRKRRQMG